MLDTHLLLLAFGAGILGFFAPCSVAMLPAFIGFFLGKRDINIGPNGPAMPAVARPLSGLGLLVAAAGLALALWAVEDIRHVLTGESRMSLLQVAATALAAALLIGGFYLAAPRRGVLAGLAFGIVTTVGILLTYVVLGLLVIVLLGLVTFQQMAWGVIGIGAFLVLAGVAGFLGRDVAFTIPIRAPMKRNAVGFFAFGVAYGIVSLGCNLPLLALPLAAASTGPAGGVLGFLAYGAGAGILMIVVSVSVAASRGLTAHRIRQFMPYLRAATNALFVAAGAYIIWYAWANFIQAGA